MPPKKHEVQIVVEVPDQPPTIECNPSLVDKLLQVVLTYPNDAAATVAGALRLNDYLTNLQHGIIVDLMVETLIECAAQGLKANKALALLELAEALRVSIVETQSDYESKIMIRNFFVRHAGLAVREKEQLAAGVVIEGTTFAADGAQLVIGSDGKPIITAISSSQGGGLNGVGNAENLAGAVAGSTTAAVGSSAPPSSPAGAAVKGVKGGKKKGVEEPPPPPKPTFDAGPFYLDLEEMKVFAPFFARGIIQHWQLYATVGTYQRTELFVPAAASISDAVLEPVINTFIVGIQTPMPSHSLASALTLEEHTRQHADETAKAAAERASLQAREEAQIASEKASLEAAAARRKAAEEEERAGMLYLKKATAERAIDQLTSSIESELTERQRRIIQRIQKLEDALQLATGTAL